MQDFYEKFYAAAAQSSAHAAFCERVFGKNLCQHGFADMAQVDRLLEITRLKSGQHALDLGSGSGLIAEYLSDCTGAQVTGLDYIAGAIHQAQARTCSKVDRLAFVVGDINALELPDGAYDLILSIDTLYFSQDYAQTIRQLVQALRPGGQMAIYYAYGREPWVPKESFSVDRLTPERTPLGEALRANGLNFETWDFTADDGRLAQRRQQVLAELRPQFEAEDLLFIYDNRIGDAQGIRQAISEGLHRRYLYHVQLPR